MSKIDKAIFDYRDIREAMAITIDNHMRAAMIEIQNEFGTTPTEVSLSISLVQRMQDKYAFGVYEGSSVRLAGD